MSWDYTKSLGGHVWAKLGEFLEEFRIGTCEQNKGDPQGSLGVFGNNLTQVFLYMDNCTAVLTSAHSHSYHFYTKFHIFGIVRKLQMRRVGWDEGMEF